MDGQESILDKIIQSRQLQEAAQFNPSEIVSNLLRNVSTKERDILSKRYGLFGKGRETLENIGKAYQITRERIRQIEVGTIRKIKQFPEFSKEIETAEHNILHLLENYGGIMEETHLVDELLSYSETNPANQSASIFLINNLLDDKLEKIKKDQHLLDGWKLPAVSLEIMKNLVNELATIIELQNKLIETQEIIKYLKDTEQFKNSRDHISAVKLGSGQNETTDEDIDKVILSLLKISRNIEQNILGEWGLAHWQTVQPKRMSDKAYLVLRKTKKPLHFTEITNLINEIRFDQKTAYPATIHNELILDDRYVLVGRGIYALKEWGYREGTVLDVIIEILGNSGEPLTKDEILQKVLDQRLVRKSTIYLALTNKEKIKKLPDNRYSLA